MNFEILQFTVSKAVDPVYRCKPEVNDKIEDIITVDLVAVSVVLFKISMVTFRHT